MSAKRTAMDVDAVLGPGNWSIAPAEGAGSTGRSWIASDGSRQLFIKEGVDAQLLRALAVLDVSPPVIASEADSAVQEFVVGTRPDGRWIYEHIGAVISLMNHYHGAAPLRELARPLTPVEYVSELADRVELSDLDALRAALDGIAGDAGDHCGHAPTLTHGDPNTSNFILRTDGRLFLVDWDDARVADHLRDIGPLLWWYVPPAGWERALLVVGAACDGSDRSMIHWWAAARSIEVALWLIEHGDGDGAATFAHDAWAAARGLPNPRGWWLT